MEEEKKYMWHIYLWISMSVWEKCDRERGQSIEKSSEKKTHSDRTKVHITKLYYSPPAAPLFTLFLELKLKIVHKNENKLDLM